MAVTVSVVICNYNYARFISRAVQSACEQTYPCEVIVVDDGSTDGSVDALTPWLDHICLIRKSNGGQPSAYNAGFERSSGEIVIFLDSDDFLRPNAVARIVEAMEPGVSKVHFFMSLVDTDGISLESSIPSVLAEGDVWTDLSKHGLLYASAPGSGNAYSRSALERLMPLPTLEKHGADFFLIYGVPLYGPVKAIREPLASYRVHVLPKAGDTAEFVFGNASQQSGEAARMLNRGILFGEWLLARSGGKVKLPGELYDFAMLKGSFVSAVLGGDYLSGVAQGVPLGPKLMRSIWLNPSYSVARKGGLSAWMLLVLFAPRAASKKLATYVTNPASRGGFSLSTLLRLG